MFRTFLLILFLIPALLPLKAQQIPSSNVYLFDMKRLNDSTYQFSRPRWLTHFNRNGYNNHPSFFDEELVYLSAQMPYEKAPDIFALNLRDTTRTRITATDEGEFSPVRMPDYLHFSAIRQEFTGRDTITRLWQFPVNRQFNDNGKPLFKYQTNIGYYHWINSNQVALFLTERPSILAIGDVRTDKIQNIALHVGRTFRTLPGGRLLYVQQSDTAAWKIMEWDPIRGGQAQFLINTLANVQDFAVMEDGTILMGSGSKLYKFNRQRDQSWVEIADFSSLDIRRITRLVVSRSGKLLVVSG